MSKSELALIEKAEIFIEQSNFAEAKSILLRILKEINNQSIDAMNNLAVVFILKKILL